MRNKIVRINKGKNIKMERGSIFEQGYGMIPKLVMRDKRLSIEAKSIYAYICSFAGAGTEAFPSISLMLNELKISKDRFYRHMKLLVDCKYLIKHHTIEDDNRFSGNIYELVQAIDEEKSKILESFK